MQFLQTCLCRRYHYGLFNSERKINRGVKGRNIPSGVVKWLVEVVNQRDEVVCVATILTLVAKQSPLLI
jgi:oxepin-CoA hydrolase/3-oxo-5,6-dehydrosuberyl-CoA semialdehyde dehydrogenase